MSSSSNLGHKDFNPSREVTFFPWKSIYRRRSQYGSKGSKSVRCLTRTLVVTENEISCRGVFANEISAGGGDIDRRKDAGGSGNGDST